MKKIALLLSLIVFATINGIADDLTAFVTNTKPGTSVGSIDLTVSGGAAPYTYSWTGPNGSLGTSEDISNLKVGTYTVTVTDKYCGVATLTVKVTDQPMGISAESATNSIILAPNPTNDQFTIRSNEQLQQASIRILNISGKMIRKEENLNGTDFTIDVSGLSAGIYFVEVVKANTVSRVKFVKK